MENLHILHSSAYTGDLNIGENIFYSSAYTGVYAGHNKDIERVNSLFENYRTMCYKPNCYSCKTN